MVRITRLLVALIVAFCAFVVLRSYAADTASNEVPLLVEGKTGCIETKADKLNYYSRSGWVEALSNVVVRMGNKELRADYVRVNVKTGDTIALGNVTFKQPGTVWRGGELRGNFRTGNWSAASLACDATPFRVIESERAEKGVGDEYVFHNVIVTTCTNEHPHCHYHVRARELSIVPGENMKAHGAAWRFGKVPVLYLPYWYRNLREDLGFRFYPGYNTRMGPFLLSSYRYRLNPLLRGETHADYRSERGLGVGQDFKWREVQGRWSGDMSLYYTDDKKPFDEDEDPESADIDNNRYRIRLRHNHNFDDRNYMFSQIHYLSDTDILEDFFEDEYRESNEPENYLVYSHRGDKFTANMQLQARLNDFYSKVNRLPECSVDFMRREIGASSLYYEGQAVASFLQQVWEESITNQEDYSVFRIDSPHMFYRPAKFFGFLNVNPRIGYRGTYYSKTLDTKTTEEIVTSLQTNAVTDARGNTSTVVAMVTETNNITTQIETGAELRSRVELGLETSFKAFKTWDRAGGGLRHIAEPYMNYTFVPEPTLLPERIYQIDGIDTFGKEHWTQFGVRNKLQTKRGEQPFDLVDANVYSKYKIEREEGENPIDDIYFDTEVRPSSWFQIDLDGQFDTEESEINTFNSRVTVLRPDLWTASAEYRFIVDESSLLSGTLTLSPNRNWSFEVYGRYEFEDSRLEEEWGYIRRNFDCMALKTGVGLIPGYTASDGSEEEDEWRFTIEFWLTAFPETSLSGKHRN